MDGFFLFVGFLGSAGALGMLGLASLLIWPFWIYREYLRDKSGTSTRMPVSKIEILIPVHNEERVLRSTLRSIHHAIHEFSQAHPQVGVTLKVGLDSCSDLSEQIAKDHPCEIHSCQFKSKWKTLSALLSQSDGDWVVFADAGIQWPEGFLCDALAHLERSDLVGVAPAYSASNVGVLESLHWFIESGFKRFESQFLGGPVSVHGATVFYRRAAVQQVFAQLAGQDWAVDDVVIPLVLRGLFPQSKILYWEGGSRRARVQDLGVDQEPASAGRRERIALGNLQWVRSLLVWAFQHNRVVGFLLLRRVFRLFWGYWLLLLVLGSFRILGGDLFDAGALALILSGLVVGLRAAAFFASIKSPFYLIRRNDLNLIRWS